MAVYSLPAQSDCVGTTQSYERATHRSGTTPHGRSLLSWDLHNTPVIYNKRRYNVVLKSYIDMSWHVGPMIGSVFLSLCLPISLHSAVNGSCVLTLPAGSPPEADSEDPTTYESTGELLRRVWSVCYACWHAPRPVAVYVDST